MTTFNNQYTPAQKNYALCRKELDLIPNGNFLSQGYEACRNMQFFRIKGLTGFWKTEEEINSELLMGDILNSCVRHGVPFAYAIIGDERGIQVYAGTLKILRESLQSSYESMFPGIDVELTDDNPLRNAPREWGGMFTGIPTDKRSEDKKSYQIENICRGMQNRRFTYLILASGLSSNEITFGHEKLLREMEIAFSLVNQTVTGGRQGNIAAQQQDYTSKNYLDNLEILESSLQAGVTRGMWRVNGYFACDDQVDAMRLGNIIKASYSGQDSRPEPFRTIDYNSIGEVISNMYMMADQTADPEQHPLGHWFRSDTGLEVSLFIYRFQTILTSDQLGIMCRLPEKEFPGYYIDEYVEFDIASRFSTMPVNPIALGDICTAGRSLKNDVFNQYLMEKNDLTRHALIIGITGGGKTNTSKSLLNTLWNAENPQEKIPFLVIESAKREYWELRNLRGFEDLLVFTLGAEASATSVRYRLNPFEASPGISLQTHIDYLLSTFKAAFELYPPMP